MNEIIILPYRNKKGHKEYLVKIEQIENWDLHPDTCSISLDFDEKTDINGLLKTYTDTFLNIHTEEDHFFNLGVCKASKDSKKTYYLYCINISKLESSYDETKYKFITKEELVENIDAQLIVAYSRMNFLTLN